MIDKIRFAYESGIKCLYPKFNDQNAALVTNHREAGENYRDSIGTTEVLISSVASLLTNMWEGHVHVEHPRNARYFDFKQSVTVSLDVSAIIFADITVMIQYCNQIHDAYTLLSAVYTGSSIESACAQYCSGILSSALSETDLASYMRNNMSSDLHSSALSKCLSSRLLTAQELSRWQYDFNLRRAGMKLSPEALSNFSFTMLFERNIGVSSDHLCLGDAAVMSSLSALHWGHIMHMLEANVPRNSISVHFGCSYLMRALLFYDVGPSFLQHRAVIRYNDTPTNFQSCIESWRKSIILEGCPFVFVDDKDLAGGLSLKWIETANLAIISLNDMIDGAIFLSLMNSLQFLLVLVILEHTSCTYAPIQISLLLNSTATFDFTTLQLIESYCSADTDLGGLLFRRSSITPGREEKVSRTLSLQRNTGNIIHRRVFNGIKIR